MVSCASKDGGGDNPSPGPKANGPISGEFKLSKEELKIIDNNHDGIWDDVEPYVKKNSRTDKEKRALEQVVKSMQMGIENPSLGKQIRLHSEVGNFIPKSIACLYIAYPDYNSRPAIIDIEAALLDNQLPRIRSYMKYNANMSGGSFTAWNEAKQGEACE